MFQVCNNVTPEIFNFIFKLRTMPYKLLNHNSFERCPDFILHDDSWPWYLEIGEARFLKKKAMAQI